MNPILKTALAVLTADKKNIEPSDSGHFSQPNIDKLGLAPVSVDTLSDNVDRTSLVFIGGEVYGAFTPYIVTLAVPEDAVYLPVNDKVVECPILDFTKYYHDLQHLYVYPLGWESNPKIEKSLSVLTEYLEQPDIYIDPVDDLSTELAAYRYTN